MHGLSHFPFDIDLETECIKQSTAPSITENIGPCQDLQTMHAIKGRAKTNMSNTLNAHYSSAYSFFTDHDVETERTLQSTALPTTQDSRLCQDSQMTNRMKAQNKDITVSMLDLRLSFPYFLPQKWSVKHTQLHLRQPKTHDSVKIFKRRTR